MAEITRIPAGLNVTCGIGDVLILQLNFKSNGDPLDITEWTLEGENVDVEVLDAELGEVQLTFSEETSKLNDWFIRRADPAPKRLLSGYIQFVSTADESTPNDPIEINLLDSPDLILEVIVADKGDKGDKGDPAEPLSYGAFYCDAGQVLLSTTESQVVGMNGVFESSGVELIDNSKIRFNNAGAYTVTWSIQFANDKTNQAHTANVWHRLNGVNIPLSNSRFDIPTAKAGVDGYLVGTVNFVLTVGAGDDLELYWAGSDLGLKMATFPANGGLDKPATPCVILTAVQITHDQTA